MKGYFERDYLDRESLLLMYDKQHEGPPGKARKLIEEFPANPDVVEFRHGYWRSISNKHTCSVCKFTYWSSVMKLFNHCPECGAKMDLRSRCCSTKKADETEERG